MRRAGCASAFARRLLLAAVGAVALALVVGVVAFNLFLGQRLSASATSLARAQAAAELSSLEIVDGKLVVAEPGLDEGAPSAARSGCSPARRSSRSRGCPRR